MTHEVSIVTAFFDIGRGNWQGFARSNQQYLDWFKNLARLKNEMVIFTEPKFADAIVDMRKENGLESITKVMTTDRLFDPNGRLGETISLLEKTMGARVSNFYAELWSP